MHTQTHTHTHTHARAHTHTHTHTHTPALRKVAMPGDEKVGQVMLHALTNDDEHVVLAALKGEWGSRWGGCG